MTQLASNHLSVSAEIVRDLLAESNALAAKSIDKALEAGHLLVIAKEECRHGEWLPFLKRAGIHERQARRLMTLAGSGLKSDSVSDLGGIKAALDYISKRDTAARALRGLEFQGWSHVLRLDGSVDKSLIEGVDSDVIGRDIARLLSSIELMNEMFGMFDSSDATKGALAS